jgi:hypothetical protein
MPGGVNARRSPSFGARDAEAVTQAPRVERSSISSRERPFDGESTSHDRPTERRTERRVEEIISKCMPGIVAGADASRQESGVYPAAGRGGRSPTRRQAELGLAVEAAFARLGWQAAELARATAGFARARDVAERPRFAAT